MSALLRESARDVSTVKIILGHHDDFYLNICGLHMQQAIEKIMKYSIEIRGLDYQQTHDIHKLYETYVAAGWDKFDTLDMMSDTFTQWKHSYSCGYCCAVTTKQLNSALLVYEELYNRVRDYFSVNS